MWSLLQICTVCLTFNVYKSCFLGVLVNVSYQIGVVSYLGCSTCFAKDFYGIVGGYVMYNFVYLMWICVGNLPTHRGRWTKLDGGARLTPQTITFMLSLARLPSFSIEKFTMACGNNDEEGIESFACSKRSHIHPFQLNAMAHKMMQSALLKLPSALNEMIQTATVKIMSLPNSNLCDTEHNLVVSQYSKWFQSD